MSYIMKNFGIDEEKLVTDYMVYAFNDCVEYEDGLMGEYLETFNLKEQENLSLQKEMENILKNNPNKFEEFLRGENDEREGNYEVEKAIDMIHDYLYSNLINDIITNISDKVKFDDEVKYNNECQKVLGDIFKDKNYSDFILNSKYWVEPDVETVGQYTVHMFEVDSKECDKELYEKVKEIKDPTEKAMYTFLFSSNEYPMAEIMEGVKEYNKFKEEYPSLSKYVVSDFAEFQKLYERIEPYFEYMKDYDETLKLYNETEDIKTNEAGELYSVSNTEFNPDIIRLQEGLVTYDDFLKDCPARDDFARDFLSDIHTEYLSVSNRFKIEDNVTYYNGTGNNSIYEGEVYLFGLRDDLINYLKSEKEHSPLADLLSDIPLDTVSNYNIEVGKYDNDINFSIMQLQEEQEKYGNNLASIDLTATQYKNGMITIKTKLSPDIDETISNLKDVYYGLDYEKRHKLEEKQQEDDEAEEE